jgi:hypothetical protein
MPLLPLWAYMDYSRAKVYLTSNKKYIHNHETKDDDSYRTKKAKKLWKVYGHKEHFLDLCHSAGNTSQEFF